MTSTAPRTSSPRPTEPAGIWFSICCRSARPRYASTIPTQRWPRSRRIRRRVVLTEMQARYDDLSTKLSWLSRLADKDPARGKDGAPIRTSPLNPGFEPSTSRVVRMSANSPRGGGPAPATPGGWQLAGGMGAKLAVDLSDAHSGRGSLRLDAPAPPAAVASDEFTPDVSIQPGRPRLAAIRPAGCSRSGSGSRVRPRAHRSSASPRSLPGKTGRSGRCGSRTSRPRASRVSGSGSRCSLRAVSGLTILPYRPKR